jgi:hypothetical protein
VQETNKHKGLLVFQIKVIYKLSLEVVFHAKNAELQISFDVFFTYMYLMEDRSVDQETLGSHFILKETRI